MSPRRDHSTDGTGEDLTQGLRTFVRLATAAASACREPLPDVEYNLLGLVATQPRRAGRLAQHLAVSKAGVTKAMTALEERGLIERRPVENDARGVEAHITPSGRRVLAKADDAYKQFFLTVGTPEQARHLLDAVLAYQPALDREFRRLSGDETVDGPRLLPHLD